MGSGKLLRQLVTIHVCKEVKAGIYAHLITRLKAIQFYAAFVTKRSDYKFNNSEIYQRGSKYSCRQN